MYELGRNDVNGTGASAGAAAGLGSALNQSVQAKRIPQVTEQVEGLMKRAEGLHQVASMLDQRLSGVLVPEPPTPLTDRPQTEPSSAVALASQLVTVNQMLGGLHARLNSLLQRIEL